jgi:hypothetical protein
MNKDWVAGSYKKLGDEAAQLLDDVLGTGVSLDASKDTI